jgi:hypothetical protein
MANTHTDMILYDGIKQARKLKEEKEITKNRSLKFASRRIIISFK